MKIVFLDRKTIGDDIDLSAYEEFGEVVTYDFTTAEEAPERVRDADILIVNKVPMNAGTLKAAEKLRLICVTATGTNNLDKEYLAERGIAWRNVAGYSTECVAQHTFAMLFYLWEHLPYYDAYVKDGRYVGDRVFSHFEATFSELSGKLWGIIGLGAIGRRVAQIAECFGANVQYYSTSGKNHGTDYLEKDLDTLLHTSDIISIHCPLTPDTENLIDEAALSLMKRSAVLLNLARGPVVNEAALADALENDGIAAAGLDVLSQEPMAADNSLRRIQDSGKLLITPHIAWAGKETRERLMQTIYEQIAEFVGADAEE
ncbi:MAG: D-2-hydroxyacid dehydrogenase [Lachnospiraceae bacterium]|nr:D-2-hydroxyacid dehydrogenase [Lachnospiraceae bacterium]